MKSRLWLRRIKNFIIISFCISCQDSYDINDMDYHWDNKQAVIILDDEMSEFELADAQSERKLVKYVIGIIRYLITYEIYIFNIHAL